MYGKKIFFKISILLLRNVWNLNIVKISISNFFKILIEKTKAPKFKFLYRAAENGDKISQIYKCLNKFDNNCEENEFTILTFIIIENSIIYFETDYIWNLTNKFQNLKQFSIIKNLKKDIKNFIDNINNNNNNDNNNNNNDNNNNNNNNDNDNYNNNDNDNDNIDIFDIEKGFSKNKIMIGENYIEINNNF